MWYWTNVDQLVPLSGLLLLAGLCACSLLLPKWMSVYADTELEHDCAHLSQVPRISVEQGQKWGFLLYFQYFKKPNKVFTHKIHAGKMKCHLNVICFGFYQLRSGNTG